MIPDLLELFTQRILSGILTLPDMREGLLIVAGGIILSSGAVMIKKDLYRTPDTLFQHPFIIWSVRIFFVPALAEELFFRGILLPHISENPGPGRMLFAATLSLTLYVLAHPLSAQLFRPELQNLFKRPAFLAVTFIVGLVNTVLYWLTGSLWPPVILHWSIVMGWRLLYANK